MEEHTDDSKGIEQTPPLDQIRKKTDDEQNVDSSPTPPVNAERLTSERIKELNIAISDAKTAYEESAIEIVEIIQIWMSCCLVVSIAFICFLFHIYHTPTPETWIGLISKSITKILISGSFIALITYFFNMLSSYVQLYQNNRRKQAILASFASFVEAADKDQRKIIFIKLVETVISSQSEKIPKFKDSDEDSMEILKALKRIEGKVV